jgi:two-component system, LytTR family, sensor kinase
MVNMRVHDRLLLYNVLGHAGGALIFAIFLVLLFSGRGWSGRHGRNLTGLAAALSLVWNLGSLVILAFPGLPPRLLDVTAAVSFSVLSLLPAVLLQLSLDENRRTLVACGYALSTVAIGMHVWEIHRSGAALHQIALQIITIGFISLTAIAVAGAAFRRGGWRSSGGTRVVASMCLALFAMSFLHFGTGHADQAWSGELVIHHAGIPLALFVLLQDYRFVLLDAFVRFLANALLAAVLTGLVIEAAFRLVLVERASREPLPEALLLISVCLFLVFFAWLRTRVQAWLTRAVFRQGGLTNLVQRIRNAPEFSEESQYLDWAAAALAEGVGTGDYAVAGLPAAAGLHAPVVVTALSSADLAEWSWAEAAVPMRLGEGETRVILLGRRRGGRRYLGNDLDALGKAAAEIAGKVVSLRRQEMKRLVSQAELRALQSQINPHFLFNALNTLYGTIPREATAPRRMVLNLADIFRYFLQSDKTFVPLSEEMRIVRAYLEVEQSRLAGRLTTEIQVDEGALEIPIPVLSIQPLVENAIKHGVAQRSEPGYVRIRAECAGDRLRIAVENSAASGGAGATGAGVGLQNVRRRLEICYGAASGLSLSVGAEKTRAEILIPLARTGTEVGYFSSHGR